MSPAKKTVKTAKIPEQKLALAIRLMERRDIPRITQWLSGKVFRSEQLTNYPVDNIRLLKNELLKDIAVNRFIFARTQLLLAEVNQSIPVGVIILNNIDWRHRHCDLQIYIQPEFRGTDIPLTITKQVYTYIFTELNMHKIYTYVRGDNSLAIKAHKEHNHEPEAILYDYIPTSNGNIDLYVYGTFKRDVIQK